MTVGVTGHPTARTDCAPLVAAIADDAGAAARIERALAGGELVVESRSGDPDDVGYGSGGDPAVLVAAFGRGVTVRDQQMRRLLKSMPQTRLVAIMPPDSRRGVRRALEAGADGVVFEDELETALKPAVRAVLAGLTAVPAAARRDVERPTLSGREKQVLGMVVAGMSNKAIAARLYLAESTVKCHLSSAFAKLGVRSRNEAADLVLHSGAELGLSFVPAPTATVTGEPVRMRLRRVDGTELVA